MLILDIAAVVTVVGGRPNAQGHAGTHPTQTLSTVCRSRPSGTTPSLGFQTDEPIRGILCNQAMNESHHAGALGNDNGSLAMQSYKSFVAPGSRASTAWKRRCRRCTEAYRLHREGCQTLRHLRHVRMMRKSISTRRPTCSRVRYRRARGAAHRAATSIDDALVTYLRRKRAGRHERALIHRPLWVVDGHYTVTGTIGGVRALRRRRRPNTGALLPCCIARWDWHGEMGLATALTCFARAKPGPAGL